MGTQYTNGIYLQLIDSYDIIDIYIGGQQVTAPLRANVPLNEWKHWAVVGTPTETKIYIDGVCTLTASAHDLNQQEVYI